ncbi:unnamed protein product [Aspergillus oryzae]|uniref:Unnamed protein product n=3 Tax=Aspergillus oryzae TaxID=5062 RepID=A0AAN4YUR3_ASPOZ|nr:unnamed protein product [Aspergillus oryzae]GMF96345.1 unnamed protein product [Aspergillus oryzae]GMG15266.1 unnamed protein product [Aspergillus oryzae]GMG37884.1 unnamed protein product [Aspergillus oryzae]GMG52848.1 unnamed protein product [Aspergillus oryzae var. brunneus]
MLDIVSGHFALVEHASNGSLPCSLASEFAHIARQHVRDVNGGRGLGEIMDATLTPAQRPFRGHIKTGSGVVSNAQLPVALEHNAPVRTYLVIHVTYSADHWTHLGQSTTPC